MTLVNHGLPPNLTESAWGESAKFFELPPEAKRACAFVRLGRGQPRLPRRRRREGRLPRARPARDVQHDEHDNPWPSHAALTGLKPLVLDTPQGEEKVNPRWERGVITELH